MEEGSLRIVFKLSSNPIDLTHNYLQTTKGTSQALVEVCLFLLTLYS